MTSAQDHPLPSGKYIELRITGEGAYVLKCGTELFAGDTAVVTPEGDLVSLTRCPFVSKVADAVERTLLRDVD